jgi:hypothetical protein
MEGDDASTTKPIKTTSVNRGSHDVGQIDALFSAA